MTQPFLPFCLPLIGEEEIRDVVECLRSGWITTGPRSKRFEELVREYIGCKHAVGVNSCTAALHLSLAAYGLGRGDEVITTPLTFAATVNTILHVGATPVLADIDLETGNIDPAKIEERITHRTRAIVPVHYAGLPCDLDRIKAIARRHNLIVIEDAAHAIGAKYKGKQIGKESQAACYSFYPIKNMTTIEGGLIATQDEAIASKLRSYSSHGMSRNAWARYSSAGSWFYEITYPGFKYNMTDIQAAVGIPQLQKLEGFIATRRNYAQLYRTLLKGNPYLKMPADSTDARHCYHLFVVRVEDKAPLSRNEFIEALKERGIGTAVNFIPIPIHPYYRDVLGLKAEQFPNAVKFYEGAVSLPLYPKMTEGDVHRVADTINELLLWKCSRYPSA